jgi:hypothetical protein
LYSEQFSDEEFSDDAPEEEEADSEEMDDAERMERQVAMDKLVPALDPSEYGKMPPSFYGNSQRVAATTVKTDKVETSGATDKESAMALADAKTKEKFARPPILARDKYEGVDSDDETDEEADESEEEEEEKPQVVGEVEIDMAEEEEEFLEFSRQTLGISDEHWNEIIQDRKRRGGEHI